MRLLLMTLALASVPQFASAKAPAKHPTRSVASTAQDFEVASVTGTQLRYLSQGWTPQQRHDWYERPQGSFLIPEIFAAALENETGQKFFTGENMRRYGYLPQRVDAKTNPMGLPVGFAIDGYMRFDKFGSPQPRGERWVGMTCAACHTGQLHYKNTDIRIDGGPSQSDFQRVIGAMDAAVDLTVSDKGRLDRFVSEVSERPGVKKDRAQIERAFRDFAKERKEWEERNGSHFLFGGGRNDAFGVIFNQALARDLHIPSNASEPNAPVSYPVIWDAPQHDVVQWNGLASNDPYLGGAIARNSGEVLGVFGRVDPHSITDLGGFCSSVRHADLEVLEDEVTKLWSPVWPQDILPKLDQKLVAEGRTVYAKNCVSCHADIERADPKRKIKAVLIPMEQVGTDQKMNLNAVGKMVDTGPVFGRNTRLIKGRPLEAEEPGATVLKHMVASVLIGAIAVNSCGSTADESAYDLAHAYAGLVKKAIVAADFTPEEKMNRHDRTQFLIETASRYKARPLNGIWSSAPFLHNGSVRSLKQLLTPSGAREKAMIVGCEDFDPVEVGLACRASDLGKNERLSSLDLTIDGNRNTGHEYGTSLKDDEKMALIEYMKSI